MLELQRKAEEELMDASTQIKVMKETVIKSNKEKEEIEIQFEKYKKSFKIVNELNKRLEARVEKMEEEKEENSKTRKIKRILKVDEEYEEYVTKRGRHTRTRNFKHA